MSMKKVSVIVPVYNMVEYVEKHIGCLTSQTYSNIEILLINDGSTDNTLEVCQNAAKTDSRIVVLDKENGGPGDARNFGLSHASGEYVYFYDIDDEVKPEAIEKLVSSMEKHGVDLVACSFEMFDGKKVTQTVVKEDGYVKSGEDTRRDYYEQFFIYESRGIHGAVWYKLFKLSVIRDNGIKFPNLRISEDNIFMAQYVNHINGFALVGDVLYRYRVNNERKFWDKYQFDMFDAAGATAQAMIDIVYNWNRDNTAVRDKIYSTYFYQTFLSLRFLFNPKLRLGIKKRYQRVKEISEQFASSIPDGDFGVSHPVFRYIKRGQYARVYIHMNLYILRHMFD